MDSYPKGTISPQVTGQFVSTATGLRMHILEAGGGGDGTRPLLLLLHGFPELSFSWRKVMPLLADAGYWVVAPDQRGYGLTTGWTAEYDAPLAPFTLGALVRDNLALVAALGRDQVDAVIGHDFGSPVAGASALMRPDVFAKVVMMSAPFTAPPAYRTRSGKGVRAQSEANKLSEPIGAGDNEEGALAAGGLAVTDIHADLAALPRPRKHYQWYYSERRAASEMLEPPQGLHDFFRAYYHVKSADWAGNTPYRLSGWTAPALANLPTYYVMDLEATMPETVAPHMPSLAEIAACDWLTDEELAVYVRAFEGSGFQGSLNWYRCRTSGANDAELQLFAGRKIDVPACFIAGAKDWGIEQVPGAREEMAETSCTTYRGTTLIDNAGHWVQQEQPAAVADALIEFLADR